MNQLHERLGRAHQADVEQHLVPEAGVQQVQHRVLRATHVEIHRHPVAFHLAIDWPALVAWAEIAQVVPARAGPLRHGVGLAQRRLAARGIGGAHPILEPRQRGARVVAGALGLEAIGFGQAHRQHLFGQRHWLAVDPHDRKRLAPVALAREQPVAQLVVDRLAALPLRLEPGRDLGDRLGRVEAVDRERAVGRGRVHRAATLELHVGRLGDVPSRHHFADRQIEGTRELPVALVVARHRHDRPGAVGHEHVVGDPDRQPLVVHRVDRVAAGEDAGLLLRQLLALEIALASRGGAIRLDRLSVLGRGQRIHQRMLRRQHHVGGAEQRVGPGGEDAQCSLRTLEGELHLGPDRAANPVPLHLPGAVRPVHELQVVQQAIGVSGYLENPLAHRPPHHGEPPHLALAVDDLLVRQHRAQRRTPVDRHVGHVGEPALEELEKDPLGPAVVVRIGGVDLALPVVREPHALHLPAEVRHVLGRGDPRVDPGLDRVLLRRQAEGIPAHRVEHVEAAHPLHARHDVGGDVALEVTDVEPRARWIREHVEAVELRAPGHPRGAERGVLVPVALPARLDFCEGIVAHDGQGLKGARDELSVGRSIAGLAAGVTVPGGATV